MPVIPEKRQLDARVAAGLGAQFWAQPVTSARALAGTATTVPCEPPPLPLVAPPGLSRTQLLVAAHAAGLPLFPGWCEEHGGTVLDRVLLQSGRQSWWAALTGRLKAQRMVGQRGTHTLRGVLSDPDNYALAASGRLLLSHATTLRGSLQLDSLAQLQPAPGGWRPRWARKAPAAAAPPDAAATGTAGGSARQAGPWAALQLKQALVESGYELTADLALNEPSLDGVRPAAATPLRLALDVGPRPGAGAGPLLYRAGAHGVLAPEAAGGGGGGGRGPHVLAAHAQGALALAGHRTLWASPTRPWQAGRKAGLVRRPLALPAAPAAGDRGGKAGDGGKVGGGDAAAAGGGLPGSAAPRDGGNDGAAPPPARRHASRPRRAAARGGGREGAAAPPAGPQLVAPGAVQDGLQQTTWRLERLRTDLQSWAGRARAGELLSTGAPPPRGFNDAPGGCWSAVLPAPHLRVSGLLGVLGRVPLHHATFDGAGGGASPRRRRAAAGESEGDGAAAPGARLGPGAWLRQAGGAGRGLLEGVLVGGLGGLGSFGSHLARDVGVRLFASGGASLQLGRMRRNFLDFTRLEATVDAGLTGPKVGGGGGERRGCARHPAFGLDEGGAWHALTLSATQQLAGPVRLRADWRLALDSGAPPPGRPSLGPLAAAPAAAAQLARHVGCMRGSLLDAAYGLDVVVPGSGGAVRGVAWWSPRRGEGGLELRLL
ncbi:MAG: hypothetical protein J3K34DRAFT_456450 [Monoraphidium minutum]|nr:MAG: hypothetical protein J3K34DRAFT_456450 [Monoraphidium minutum]